VSKLTTYTGDKPLISGAMGGSLPHNYKVRETFVVLENSNATKELAQLKDVLEVWFIPCMR